MRKLFVVLFLVALLAIPMSASANGAIPVHGFLDLNHDGAYDLYNGAPEPNLSGLGVTVYTDNAPVGDFGGEDDFYANGSTNSSGYVVFSVPAGDYVIRSLYYAGEPDACYQRSTPLNQFRSVGEAGGAITVEIGWYEVPCGGKY